jgi:hypothetical protein
VCDMSGTTRDAVDTPVTLPGGQKLTLIDTAGIRKRARVAGSKDGAESISVERAMRAMGRAEVVVMVIDASEGVTQQVGARVEGVRGWGRGWAVGVGSRVLGGREDAPHTRARAFVLALPWSPAAVPSSPPPPPRPPCPPARRTSG